MKSNTFNYSLLAVGVAALMGVSSGAMADTPTGGTNGATIDIANKASAQYTVAGTTQNAVSNEVTVIVSEQSAFELLAQDGTDTDSDTVNPEAGQTATFVHTLQNNGNVNDTYTIDVANQNGDDFDYSGYTITYITNLDTTEQTLTNGGTLGLAPNEIATITIVATSDNTARQINDKGVITVTASSAYLEINNSGNTAAYTAENVDTGITSTPIYAIKKSAATNFASNDKFFDTANPNAYIDYTITIKNEGNAAATAFNIEDTLPAGLVALTTFTPQINGTDVVASNFTFSNQNKTLTVTGQDLAQNESLTLTFRAVKEDGVTIDSGTALTNYAQVEDDTANDNNADTPDLIDRSDDGTTPGGNSENNYEDPNLPADQDGGGKDDNTDATVTTRNQTRNLTISDDPEKEVPLKSTGNVYNYTITSTSTDVTEADAPGEVFITVEPTTDNPDITITNVFVDANGNGKFDTGEELTSTSNSYDLNQAVPAGLNTNESVNISVEVATNGDSGAGVAGDIGTSEVMTITIQPQGAVDGTAAPASDSTTSTTKMEGVILTKEQAVASCTSPGTLSYGQAAITNVEPGQCIYYQITATSTFSETVNAISNLQVSDVTSNWAGKATYTGDDNATSSTGSTAGLGTDPNGAEAVTTTFATLAPGASANLTFSVQIDQ